jgi:ABC-type spermidine/putrescine transport system permease subunit II
LNIAAVAVIVRARTEGFGKALEEAAADLGAPPWRAFRRP